MNETELKSILNEVSGGRMTIEAAFKEINYAATRLVDRELSIIPYGSKAKPVMGKASDMGLITAVTIRDTKVKYELSVFAEGKHTTTWMDAVEIDTKVQERTTVGYRGQNN